MNRASSAQNGYAELPLGDEVWRLFRELPRSGSLPEPAPGAGLRLLRGEAGSESQGTWIVFHIYATDGGRVTEVRFQAYGCPHTLATAAWLAGQLPERQLENLLPSAPADWAAALAVPVEKLGRLLLIEDALRAITAGNGAATP